MYEPLITIIGEILPLLFYKDGFGIKQSAKVDTPLSKTKPNQDIIGFYFLNLLLVQGRDSKRLKED